MKKFVTSVLFALIAVVLVTGCYKTKHKRKQKDNATECKYTVNAVDPGVSGYHFLFNDQTGCYLLNAVNYEDYKSKIVPGQDYVIGFYETQCDDQVIRCGGILPGGCFCQLKCIVITCLTALPPKEGDCLTCSGEESLSELSSMATGSSTLNGNSLVTSMNIRSYNPEADMANMTLYYSLVLDKSLSTTAVVPVKIVQRNQNPVVNAEVEKQKCFDLSSLKNEILKNKSSVKTVKLQLLKSDQVTVEEVTWNIQ